MFFFCCFGSLCKEFAESCGKFNPEALNVKVRSFLFGCISILNWIEKFIFEISLIIYNIRFTCSFFISVQFAFFNPEALIVKVSSFLFGCISILNWIEKFIFEISLIIYNIRFTCSFFISVQFAFFIFLNWIVKSNLI